MITHIVFILLALVAVGATLSMMWIKDLVRTFFLFFTVLVSVAGLFLFSLADFIALSHLLIYIGGILVLMLFALMLAGHSIESWEQSWINQQDRWNNSLSIVLSILFFGFFGYFAWHVAEVELPTWITSNNTIEANDNSIEPLGQLLMTRYLLPFELISILLLMVLLGATHLSRKTSEVG
jgi:NAD(P)H-quinone oxidoreductase subunit 6